MPIEVDVTAPPAPSAAAPAPPAAGGRQGGAGRRGGGPAGPTSTSTRVWIDQAHTTVQIPVAAEPTAVALDPHTWVSLMHATFKKQ